MVKNYVFPNKSYIRFYNQLIQTFTSFKRIYDGSNLSPGSYIWEKKSFPIPITNALV